MVCVVLWVKHTMVNNPHSYFSMDAERRITIQNAIRERNMRANGVETYQGHVSGTFVPQSAYSNRDRIYAHNRDYYMRYRTSYQTEPENVSDDNTTLQKYHGCRDCWKFSMLFGGSYEAVFGNIPEKRNIKNEDDFEVVKGEFVKHFNEKHKDLFPIRKAKVAKSYKQVGTSFGTGQFTSHVITTGSDYNSIPTNPRWRINAVVIDERAHVQISVDDTPADGVIPYSPSTMRVVEFTQGMEEYRQITNTGIQSGRWTRFINSLRR